MKARSGENGPPDKPSPSIADAPRASLLSPVGGDAWSGTRTMVAVAGAAVLLLAMQAAAAVVAPIVLALVVAVGIEPARVEEPGVRPAGGVDQGVRGLQAPIDPVRDVEPLDVAQPPPLSRPESSTRPTPASPESTSRSLNAR